MRSVNFTRVYKILEQLVTYSKISAKSFQATFVHSIRYQWHKIIAINARASNVEVRRMHTGGLGGGTGTQDIH